MVIGPLRIGATWDPFQMANKWLINGWNRITTYPSPGMILQVGEIQEILKGTLDPSTKNGDLLMIKSPDPPKKNNDIYGPIKGRLNPSQPPVFLGGFFLHQIDSTCFWDIDVLNVNPGGSNTPWNSEISDNEIKVWNLICLPIKHERHQSSPKVQSDWPFVWLGLDLFVRCLKKVTQKYYLEWWFFMVMNPMVESVKHHLKQTQVSEFITPMPL